MENDLKKVDEIKVMYSDIARLADLCGDEWDHMANVVLYIPNDIKTEDIAWEAIHPYDEVPYRYVRSGRRL